MFIDILFWEAKKFMRKIILTSTGFNNKNIEKKFVKLIKVNINNAKVLFIPTAAITDEQKAIVPMCRKDLLKAGVKEENIIDYNLDKEKGDYEISEFNAIYVCGGDTKYLLDKVNEVRFNYLLDKFFENNGVYVGVSAGSIIFANNYENNLKYLRSKLFVHSKNGTANGLIDITRTSEISLTDNQAIIIEDNKILIME